MTADEQKRLMCYMKNQTATLNGRRFFLICDILLNTGLRASELCALRVMDTPYVLGRNVIEVFRGKGNKDRVIQVSSRLSKHIIHYIKKDRPDTLPRFVNRSDIRRSLFYNYSRRVYKRQTLYKMVGRTAQKAGINKSVTPHMFRHTFATNVLIKGEPPYRLKRMLGHNSLVTTMKYVHFVEDLDEQIGERIDQCFDPDLWD